MRRIIAGVVALVVAAALLTWPIDAYFAAEGIELGLHGRFATFLCLVFIPGVTIGLMLLLRYSQRKGYDERADSYARDRAREG